jgi:hypothetical protein
VETKAQLFKKISKRTLLAIVFSLFLCITTFAVVLSDVNVERNTFQTGTIQIDINGGKSILSEDEIQNFLPGQSITKTFTVSNKGTLDMYYKVYLGNVSGDLAGLLQVTLMDGETELYSGKASEFTSAIAGQKNMTLAEKQEKTLKITFTYPEDANQPTNTSFSFELCATGVQYKNNTEISFN